MQKPGTEPKTLWYKISNMKKSCTSLGEIYFTWNCNRSNSSDKIIRTCFLKDMLDEAKREIVLHTNRFVKRS